MPTLLVIDDDPLLQHLFRKAFRDEDVRVVVGENAATGLEAVKHESPDAVVLDVSLPDMPGLEVFRRIQAIDPKLPIIFITAGGNSDTVIEALKLGAFDYLLKPLDIEQVRLLVAKAFEARRLLRVTVEMQAANGMEGAAGDVLVGRCYAMQEVYKATGRVAPTDVTVLIQGDSGTGKELVARAIYHHSRRADKPFLAVNCAAIPEPLLESELFGHERGSFTGADRTRIGKFEQCSGGTLFLDEIGDMSSLVQSKVLRVLQEQKFERVGGNLTITSDVRIIAATNHDLAQLSLQGRFRGDLYYRLNVFTIKLPPLRERLDDLPLLVEYFLARVSRELGKDVRRITPEAQAALANYTWPGNVREFQSVLKQALLKSTGPMLTVDDLPSLVRVRSTQPETTTPALMGEWSPLHHFVDQRLAAGTEDLYREARQLVERQLLSDVLRRTAHNQSEAARILGITRGSLRSKLRELGISIERVARDEPIDDSDDGESETE